MSTRHIRTRIGLLQNTLELVTFDDGAFGNNRRATAYRLAAKGRPRVETTRWDKWYGTIGGILRSA
jgi:hypothetical protein